MSMGVEVVEPLAAAVPSLGRYGQLSALEVFEDLGDAGAGPVLTDLLGSEHETVRDWSAWAIAQLGVREAAPALQAAYRRIRIRGVRPDEARRWRSATH
jgi:HEAT repeat protein